MDNSKANAFVQRLLANPTLGAFNELQKEDQIFQFLDQNKSALHPTLSSAGFFPGADWSQIVNLLGSELQKITNQYLQGNLEQILYNQLDYAFLAHLRQQNVAKDLIVPQLKTILFSVLQRPEARRDFIGAYTAVRLKIVDRYLDCIFQKRSYIYFELTKVEKLKLSQREMKDLIKLVLLLKPVIHLFLSQQTHDPASYNSGRISSSFADKIFLPAEEQVRVLPDRMIRSIVNSNVSFLENRFIEATARLSAVWTSMFRHFNPGMKIDRGAATQEKSWLNVARKNYKFYGYDIKVLDELYMCSAENGW